jgi:oxygen-independent coproporphyrinogen-3 oxidase
MLGVYVHLPFCPYICPYCDFAKWPMAATKATRYLKALFAEIEATPPERAATLFLGGGTPNSYNSATISELLARLQQRFGPFEEVSIEVNPDLVGDHDFAVYREAGVTRVSIGVQSFVPAEIATLGRKHEPNDVGRVVASARGAEIPSVSLDLMFGVPGQTLESWRHSLEAAIALGVNHVSTYGLTIEEGTPYARWREREPQAFFDDVREAELYALAIELLQAAGYQQYEISNFARPGHRCVHNVNYWANGEYLGFGVGAASYRGGVRSVHTRALDRYVAAAAAREPIASESERLEGPKRVAEAIMLALRTAQGVGLEDFKERYEIDVVAHYAPVVARYAEAGLLERVGDHMRLTERGRFVANDVCGAFVTFD